MTNEVFLSIKKSALQDRNGWQPANVDHTDVIDLCVFDYTLAIFYVPYIGTKSKKKIQIIENCA